jgi:hypothetical protein
LDEIANGQDLADMIDETATPVDPETAAFGGLITADCQRSSTRRWVVTLRPAGSNVTLVRDQGDLNGSSVRDRIIEKALEKLQLGEAEGQTLRGQLDEYLMEAAAGEPSRHGQAALVVDEVQYEARMDPNETDATGFYAIGEKYERRLTNFVVRIDEERIVGDVDEGGESRSFHGTINVLGETSPFEISCDAFSEKLRQAIFNAAGAKAELLGSVDEIRTAISRASKPASRRYLTSTGWTADFSKYLVPGGYVDRDGFHEHVPGDGIPAIDLSDHEKARWLGSMHLDPGQLQQVKRHILDDLMRLHDPNVVSSVLAAVVLSALIRFANVSSWPVIWLLGLTGSGKSFLACLAMNFFGRFEGQGSGRFMSWKSTGKSIQSAGYYFRDAAYLVDDYKREDVRHADAVMVIQGASDRTGRSRLNADVSMNTTRWIRGTLLGTGEDYPDSNASGLGRTVLIRVPNPAKDYDRAQRCLSQCQFYRGWMATFLAHVIRNDLGQQFADRVQFWHRHFHQLIKGKANGARIASNHASLAAAFELFAGFMRDVWTEADEAARVFADEYLGALVIEAAGSVEEETAGRILLDTLAELIAFERARIDGIGSLIKEDNTQEKGKIVGRLVSSGWPHSKSLGQLGDEDVILLSTKLSMAAVQAHLRSQGKQPLQISERTLLDQLTHLEVLLDENHQPIRRD